LSAELGGAAVQATRRKVEGDGSAVTAGFVAERRRHFGL
jgi:hypothetical protein